jgi:hypothetical protein
MAVIYLRHPVHGAKVAISDMEAESDIHNGWEEFDPYEANDSYEERDSEDYAAPLAPEPVLDAPINQLPRRRGRPPRKATE